MSQKYSSGNPRVHISSTEPSIIAAIEEYESKMALFSADEQAFLKALIVDLREELSMR